MDFTASNLDQMLMTYENRDTFKDDTFFEQNRSYESRTELPFE